MTQAQFFDAIAHASQLTKAQVKAAFQAAESVVMTNLKPGDRIPLGGIGTVKLADRKARVGRNPATGETIKIPAKTTVKIAPAKALKDAFNKAPAKKGKK